MSAETRIGITKDVNIRGAATLLNSISKVLDLLSAVRCATRQRGFREFPSA